MKSCLVLGAGFSKSVANLPVTKEMISKFKAIMVEQEALGHKNRMRWGNIILEFITKLEKEYLIDPYSRASKGGKILKSNYFENFEALCSIIDLNISFEVEASTEENGIRSNLTGKSLFLNHYTTSELKSLRGYIGTYIYLSLIDSYQNLPILDSFEKQFLKNNPSIITFNYDLVLERYLYSIKRWFPKDGYGLSIKSIPKLNRNFDNAKSDFEILKLHGSLNWRVEDMYRTEFEINWMNDNNDYFFPGYLNEEKGRPFKYQGGLTSSGWLFPSWVKQFKYDELIQVWNKASIALNGAEQIYFIGYSLPPADSAVYALLSSIDCTNKNIIVIDPNADEHKVNYSRILRSKNIIYNNLKLEDYLYLNASSII